MKDREFLVWIHSRLVHVHGENPNVDYMHKLMAIIGATDLGKVTPNTIKPPCEHKNTAELPAGHPDGKWICTDCGTTFFDSTVGGEG